MKMVFQQKVQEKESKLKQSEEELYARHKEMKDALDKQRGDLEEKKRKIESGRPLTPEKNSVSSHLPHTNLVIKTCFSAGYQEKPLPQSLIASLENISSSSRELISCLLQPFIPSCYLDHYSTIVHFISMVFPIFSHSFAHRPPLYSFTITTLICFTRICMGRSADHWNYLDDIYTRSLSSFEYEMCCRFIFATESNHL